MKSLMRPGTGRQMRVDQAEDRVAVLHVLRDHAHRQQVVDLVDGDLAALELLIDASRAA